MSRGDLAAALDLAGRMVALGRESADNDLLAFGLLCQGECLVVLGDLTAGMRCLDEAMVSITTGEVSPIPTGIIYCGVIDTCMHACDLRRAEWTEALSTWCGSDPSLVPYRGQCLVHRSQVLMARGAWAAAGEEAARARAHLAQAQHPALGFALYQQGEMHRLRGELAEAERAYRAASRHGREPSPGLGRLRLAQGRPDAAAAWAHRVLDESRSDPDRPAILAAVAETSWSLALSTPPPPPARSWSPCSDVRSAARTRGTRSPAEQVARVRHRGGVRGDRSPGGRPVRGPRRTSGTSPSPRGCSWRSLARRAAGTRSPPNTWHESVTEGVFVAIARRAGGRYSVPAEHVARDRHRGGVRGDRSAAKTGGTRSPPNTWHESAAEGVFVAIARAAGGQHRVHCGAWGTSSPRGRPVGLWGVGVGWRPQCAKDDLISRSSPGGRPRPGRRRMPAGR